VPVCALLLPVEEEVEPVAPVVAPVVVPVVVPEDEAEVVGKTSATVLPSDFASAVVGNRDNTIAAVSNMLRNRCFFICLLSFNVIFAGFLKFPPFSASAWTMRQASIEARSILSAVHPVMGAKKALSQNSFSS
jgi:hypothetical protein